jgi:hypothetical protein
LPDIGLLRARVNDGAWSEWSRAFSLAEFSQVDQASMVTYGTIQGDIYFDDFTMIEVHESPEIPSATPDVMTIGSLSSITAYIGTIFSDLWVLIALAIGLPLGFWTIGKIIFWFKLYRDRDRDRKRYDKYRKRR